MCHLLECNINIYIPNLYEFIYLSSHPLLSCHVSSNIQETPTPPTYRASSIWLHATWYTFPSASPSITAYVLHFWRPLGGHGCRVSHDSNDQIYEPTSVLSRTLHVCVETLWPPLHRIHSLEPWKATCVEGSCELSVNIFHLYWVISDMKFSYITWTQLSLIIAHSTAFRTRLRVLFLPDVCVCVWVHVCARARSLCALTYIYIYMYIPMHKYIYIHIWIYVLLYASSPVLCQSLCFPPPLPSRPHFPSHTYVNISHVMMFVYSLRPQFFP